jgi:cytochrome c
VLRMNQTLGLACVLAFSSIGVCTLPALAAASDSNQSESEKPAPPDAGSREAPGTNSSSDNEAEGSAQSSSATGLTTVHAASPSKTARPTRTPASKSPASASGPNKAFYVITSNVVGRKVRGRSPSGAFIGRLSGFVIDTANGETPYAVIDRGGFLGFGTTQIVVPFELVDFPGESGFPIVAVDESKLVDAPEISNQDITALLHNPNWSHSVDAHYGLVPRTPTATTAAAPNKPAKVATAENPVSDEVTHGEKIAHSVCAVCHTFKKGGSTLVGPNLYGVVGRPIASVTGYNYSAALKKNSGTWDASKLDDWLKNPSSFAPGTLMTFNGLPSATDRQDVVDYLKTLNDQTAAATQQHAVQPGSH